MSRGHLLVVGSTAATSLISAFPKDADHLFCPNFAVTAVEMFFANSASFYETNCRKPSKW
jgi:hypothetical protein